MALIETELRNFYSSQKMMEHMTLLNEVLAILRSSGQTELTKELMSNLGCVFEAHLPDLHALIQRSNKKGQAEDSKSAEIKMKTLSTKEPVNSSKVLSLFKNIEENLPERLN